MSRTYKTKRKNEFPLGDAKKYSNRTRRNYGRELISEIIKREDKEEIDMPDQVHKDYGKGDLWKWD